MLDGTGTVRVLGVGLASPADSELNPRAVPFMAPELAEEPRAVPILAPTSTAWGASSTSS